MITAREASTAIYGAWRLARYDADGMRYFDNTVENFWRSFYAALIVLPAYGVLVLLRVGDLEVASGPLAILAVESLSYVIGWTAFPLAMFYLARAIDRDRFFCRYIAAYNWAAAIQIAVFLIMAAITHSGLLPAGLTAMITVAVIVAIMAYQWFIARVGLEASAGAALGIVLLDLIISLVIERYTTGIL